jgi:saccharopine dehydrogenase (NAD+, L-lysine-forming)
VHNGLRGDGPVILAVDILPCELPADSSRTLRGVAAAAHSDPGDRPTSRGRWQQSGLPAELQRATIVYRGELTPPYQYLKGKF